MIKNTPKTNDTTITIPKFILTKNLQPKNYRINHSIDHVRLHEQVWNVFPTHYRYYLPSFPDGFNIKKEKDASKRLFKPSIFKFLSTLKANMWLQYKLKIH